VHQPVNAIEFTVTTGFERIVDVAAMMFTPWKLLF
jgi:hypothetical protein